MTLNDGKALAFANDKRNSKFNHDNWQNILFL